MKTGNGNRRGRDGGQGGIITTHNLNQLHQYKFVSSKISLLLTNDNNGWWAYGG
ncbi:MAG: hypothetical protein KDK90_27685 [Leptospiraceae bacterium]|nr:hypothetical protein [Leptospiraceae bacterium]